MPRIAGEFALIERYLAPLSVPSEGAFGLKNDAAVLDIAAGDRLVATVDSLVAGRHFLPDDPPDSVARKLLRVSLSDLAAMGAEPVSYLLAASWPLDIEEEWIAVFCQGLAADQATFGVTLVGGDTTATPGPMTLTVTAFGRVRGTRVLDRASLHPGDDLYVSGTVGDAFLGLRYLQGGIDGLTKTARERLAERYRCPEPRVALGQALLERGLATAALDVSDGLAADLGHLLTASGVGAVLRLQDIPLSGPAEEGLALLGEPPEVVLSGGDDYELLFAAAPERLAEIADLSRELSLPITRIGEVCVEAGLSLLDAEQNPVALKSTGWTHF
ncbi:thiamine-phosphate kinase [Pelagibius litoralis]|uniref:Thiamine-monophosphate kinase n=1 Tax=Pelagibius litoralis TaxID=374515 RepID=A0A967C1T9_9PROT|nr:thiamine-phosphate kinase [Pelagibius litoralis]NIA67043.1 thiamine-phosphate kinase [Pelagibius litoralis]